MRVNFIFAWYDLWIGFFWDKKKKWLYIFPIPMFGLILKFRKVGSKTIRELTEIQKALEVISND